MSAVVVLCGACGGTGAARMTSATPCSRCGGSGKREIDDAMLAELRGRVVCVSGAEVDGLLDTIDALRARLAEAEAGLEGADAKMERACAVAARDAERRAGDAVAKWTRYEREYILPAFERAKRLGVDLPALVEANAGKNCVELYCDVLENRLAEAESRAAKERELADRLAKVARPKCHCRGYEMCSVCAAVDAAIAAYDAARELSK